MGGINRETGGEKRKMLSLSPSKPRDHQWVTLDLSHLFNMQGWGDKGDVLAYFAGGTIPVHPNIPSPIPPTSDMPHIPAPLHKHPAMICPPPVLLHKHCQLIHANGPSLSHWHAGGFCDISGESTEAQDCVVFKVTTAMAIRCIFWPEC